MKWILGNLFVALLISATTTSVLSKHVILCFVTTSRVQCMDFRGQLWKWVWKMTFFGLKIGWGFGELESTPPTKNSQEPKGCSATWRILMCKFLFICLRLSLLIVCNSAIQCYMKIRLHPWWHQFMILYNVFHYHDLSCFK